MKDGYISARIKEKESKNGKEYLKMTMDRGCLLEMLDFLKDNDLQVMSLAIKRREIVGKFGETHFAKVWTGEVEQSFNK